MRYQGTIIGFTKNKIKSFQRPKLTSQEEKSCLVK